MSVVEITDKISAKISKEINKQLKRAFCKVFREKFEDHAAEITRGVFTVLPEGVALYQQYSWNDVPFFEAKVVYRRADKGGIEFVLFCFTNQYYKKHGNH